MGLGLSLDKNVNTPAYGEPQDLRDFQLLKKILIEVQPDIVFHLAAQPLVIESYKNPLFNFSTNIMGTVNLLEACRNLKSIKSIINVTTDKCYENKESSQAYMEDDKLGGHDPYSSSKASSELVTSSYRKSFFEEKKIGLASARAGNVIGGGDFSDNRIIPDIYRSIKQNSKLIIRNPKAVRPWQHVFDVIFGYLILGMKLYENPKDFSESFNFSPSDDQTLDVEGVVKEFISIIGDGEYVISSSKKNLHESQLLKLNSEKARHKLGWSPKFSINESIHTTAIWYKDYMSGLDVTAFCDDLLDQYIYSMVKNEK